MVGWVIAVGVVASLALKYFWEDIAQWLNNTAEIWDRCKENNAEGSMYGNKNHE